MFLGPLGTVPFAVNKHPMKQLLCWVQLHQSVHLAFRRLVSSTVLYAMKQSTRRITHIILNNAQLLNMILHVHNAGTQCANIASLNGRISAKKTEWAKPHVRFVEKDTRITRYDLLLDGNFLFGTKDWVYKIFKFHHVQSKRVRPSNHSGKQQIQLTPALQRHHCRIWRHSIHIFYPPRSGSVDTYSNPGHLATHSILLMPVYVDHCIGVRGADDVAEYT